MDSLVHKNIVRLHYFSVFENPDARNYLVLIMEFVPVNLQKFAQRLSRENHFSVQLAKLIGLQIFTGVEYLHRRGIMHRDLKTHNMQIARRSGKVKICDFGSAKFVKPGKQFQISSIYIFIME